MDHACVRDRLGDLLEGELPLAERRALESHLGECADCARELDELREVVGLLRGLEDPEPPVYLATRVMARIADGEGRPRRFERVLAALGSPAFAAAVAAGFAGLLLTTVFETGTGGLLGSRSAPLLPDCSERTESGAVAGVRVTQASRPPAARTPATRTRQPLRAASLFGDLSPVAESPRATPAPLGRGAGAAFLGSAVFEPPLRVLDRQLLGLVGEPAAFLERMQRLSAGERERSLEALVDYSASRGDALDVAHALRSSRHPLADEVAARFERAGLRY